MCKFLITLFLALASAAPALAKPVDIYPVTCSDLWSALKDTLGDERNYGVISEDDVAQRAWFLVVGARGHYTQVVALKTRNGGCRANAIVLELGPDNGDWRQFQHRLRRSVAKLQGRSPKRQQWRPGSRNKHWAFHSKALKCEGVKFLDLVFRVFRDKLMAWLALTPAAY